MLISIQGLRAVAAWLVVIHHVMQIFYGFNGKDWFSVFFSRYGSIGVDIFFVISGFVIFLSTAGKDISCARFFSNRLIRIAPAYWVYTLLTALLIINFEGLIPFSLFEMGFLFKSLLFIPALNPSGIGYYPVLTVGWTLNFEMAFYLIFAMALFFSKGYRLPYILACMVIMQMGMHKLFPAGAFYNSSRVYEFFCGIVIAVVFQSGWLRKVGWLLASVLIFISLNSIASAYGSQGLDMGDRLIYVSIPCAVIVAALVSQEKRLQHFEYFTRLGDWSYSTYLSHVIILSVAYRTMETWEVPPLISILTALVAIMAISYLSFTFVESKSSKLLKRQLSRGK